MLLSTLWYATAVTVVPERYMKVWQKMLNNYVVGSRTDPNDKYRPPLNQMWFHDKQLGLGVPHISSKIRAQRLRLLQRLMTATALADVPAWAKLVFAQYARCMQTAWRPAHPFDFLCYEPQHLSAWLSLDALQPLWLDVWHAWSQVPMRERMPQQPELATTLSMLAWLTRHLKFLTSHGKMAALVGSHSPQARRLCQHGASNGLWSLRDFLHLDGTRVPGYWLAFRSF